MVGTDWRRIGQRRVVRVHERRVVGRDAHVELGVGLHGGLPLVVGDPDHLLELLEPR